MTVYSGSFTPDRTSGDTIEFRDPLGEAREKLRQAARLPFHASQPSSWQSQFRELTQDARSDIRRHIWLAALDGSPLKDVEQTEPRLNYQVSIQRSEHELFSENIDKLVADSGSPSPVDIWKMIELGERAILLEMALARHHNRLSELIYESTLRDVGGGG
ncbi:MAG: hypothetical protein AB7N24_15730 [Dehalococcoidia bacterium]